VRTPRKCIFGAVGVSNTIFGWGVLVFLMTMEREASHDGAQTNVWVAVARSEWGRFPRPRETLRLHVPAATAYSPARDTPRIAK
jgi:hypothetical protein